MNQDKIDQIATKVMGRTKEMHTHGPILWNESQKMWRSYAYSTNGHPFDPYNDWADCGMVIDGMRELGYGVDMGCYMPDDHCVHFTKDYITKGVYSIKDLKTAICEAALKAVES
jgi:hypothetical protein